MQIICFVNQTESIRRGHDANSTVKLDVNPANLSQEQRDTLASKFNNGSYTAHNFPLREPTLKGLLESLDAAATATKEEAAEKDKALQEAWVKFDADPRSMMWFSSCANIAHLNSPLKDAEITSERKVVFDNVQTELRHEHEQQVAEKKKEEEAAALTRATQAAIRKADEDAFRDWAAQNGSPTLQLRIKEGFSWLPIAAEEWAGELFAAARIDDSQRVGDAAEDVDVDVYNVREPSLYEMQVLRDFRTALLKELPADEFEVSLLNVAYTSKQSDDFGDVGDAEIVRQTELKVCIETPTGGSVTRFYKV